VCGKEDALSNESARSHVVEALERTIASGSARLQLRFELRWPDDLSARDFRWAGETGDPAARRLWRWLGSIAIRAFVWGSRRLVHRWSKAAAQPQHGVIDFAAHRCMYGPVKVFKEREEAVLVVEDRYWTGAPGEPIDRLSAKTASAYQPLWLLNLLRGVIDAEERGVDLVHGQPCTHFGAEVDLPCAADAISYEMALPPGVSQLQDLKEVPVEVWIDDEGYVRRARHTAPATTSVLTVDLIEFSISLPCDWSRLPTGQGGA
jgi:hypothetical protein